MDLPARFSLAIGIGAKLTSVLRSASDPTQDSAFDAGVHGERMRLWQRVGQPEKSPHPATTVARLFDATTAYRSMGSLVGSGALPFVASVSYLAGPSPDSTLALFGLSLTNQTLSFAHRGSDFVAEYHVEATFSTDSVGAAPVRQIASDEEIRVRHFVRPADRRKCDLSEVRDAVAGRLPGLGHRARPQQSAFSRAERLDTAPRFSGPSRPLR
jgi:hypothetical protein